MRDAVQGRDRVTESAGPEKIKSFGSHVEATGMTARDSAGHGCRGGVPEIAGRNDQGSRDGTTRDREARRPSDFATEGSGGESQRKGPEARMRMAREVTGEGLGGAALPFQLLTQSPAFGFAHRAPVDVIDINLLIIVVNLRGRMGILVRLPAAWFIVV